MKIYLRNYDDWVPQAVLTRKLDLPSVVINTPLRTHKIRPMISEHEDLIIVSGDWLPVHADGSTTFEGMVHSPLLYPAKSLSVQGDKTVGFESRFETLLHSDRKLILVGGIRNYYRWLIDHVPRILLADQWDDYADWAFVVNDDLAPFQIETLEMLSIGEDRLVRLKRGEAIRTDLACVPRLLSTHTFCHPMVPDLLNAAFVPRSTGQGRRIYISREDAANRRFINERALVSLLERYGFEKIVAGHLTFREQIDLFASASAVVAAHGAGLTNLVFAPEGAEVFEISSRRQRVTSMENIAINRRQRHRFIDAAVVTDWSPIPILNDWEVDLVEMEQALNEWALSAES